MPRRFGPPKMSRARTLAPEELRHLLAHLARGRHALRNTTQVLLTYWAGMRVGEIAGLRYEDAVDRDRRVRLQIELRQGEARAPRIVLLSARMRRQLAIYVNAYPPSEPRQPLFYTQKRAGWNANTLAQHFFHLYRSAGLEGASSQSGRRTFVTMLARRGVNIGIVRALAGHRRVAATRAVVASGHPVSERPSDPARDALESIS
jgi:integrase/recombinase XerD